MDGLVAIATQFSSDVLTLCMDTLSIVLTVSLCYYSVFLLSSVNNNTGPKTSFTSEGNLRGGLGSRPF